MVEGVQDLQEGEVYQDELALRVTQLKAELVLFKGLVSNVSLWLQEVDVLQSNQTVPCVNSGFDLLVLRAEGR